MDIEEFEKRQQPRAKRSRLEPFQAQIFELKAKGYANWQVAEWLEANGLKVSPEAVRKFIKSREAPSPASMPGTSTPPPASALPPTPAAPPTSSEADTSSPVDDLAGLDKKQRRERLADKFLGEEAKPKNALATRFLNQEKSK
ncbi:KorA protein [Thauera sp. 28]|uniref:hypothetical protein n=1 Tax=Thauera sp. 28 TaxID=303682 RepID=UPI0002D0F805|nr:hypothetical protein [Thauera sp. 28]ENO90955.1 KorA protein [Thauera sp. 28]